ncbi:MAG TPA: recombinase family protein [Candidatus Acidoferrales bacterium]|nr:recombinase family protein [Candidatus Acidoferrales bacterium]
MRAAIYARVSTGDQSPEMQVRECLKFCVRRAWTCGSNTTAAPLEAVNPSASGHAAHAYIDQGESGAKESRPALDALMAACRRRQVDVVVVWRFDRFARSLRQLVNALEEFRELRIQFVSLKEQIDTTTANGRLLFGIFASIAEFERELTRERVRSGLANARAKGVHLGRPHKLSPEVQLTDRVRQMRLQRPRPSWASIARTLGVSRRTVRRSQEGAGKNPQ